MKRKVLFFVFIFGVMSSGFVFGMKSTNKLFPESMVYGDVKIGGSDQNENVQIDDNQKKEAPQINSLASYNNLTYVKHNYEREYDEQKSLYTNLQKAIKKGVCLASSLIPQLLVRELFPLALIKLLVPFISEKHAEQAKLKQFNKCTQLVSLIILTHKTDPRASSGALKKYHREIEKLRKIFCPETLLSLVKDHIPAFKMIGLDNTAEWNMENVRRSMNDKPIIPFDNFLDSRKTIKNGRLSQMYNQLDKLDELEKIPTDNLLEEFEL